MNPEVLTAIIGAVALLVSPLLTKAYIARRARTPDASSIATGWSALNEAMDRERDHALEIARDQAAAHRAEMEAMQQRHASEMAQIRTEMAACKEQLQGLYAQLYDLRRNQNP